MFFWYFHPYAELNSGFSGQEITENVLGRVRGRGKRCPILRELPEGDGKLPYKKARGVRSTF